MTTFSNLTTCHGTWKILTLLRQHNQFPEVCQGFFFVGIIRTNGKISRLVSKKNYSIWNKSWLDGGLQVWSSSILLYFIRAFLFLSEVHLNKYVRTLSSSFRNQRLPIMVLYALTSVNISTSDQRCFNVVDQRWNNVGPTLKMKQNPTSDFQRCTTLIQCHWPTLKERWNNVTQRRNNVAQRWYNVDTTLFQPSVDVN